MAEFPLANNILANTTPNADLAVLYCTTVLLVIGVSYRRRGKNTMEIGRPAKSGRFTVYL